ncbi:hypothetical protein D8911_11565 [Levilactobacillus brevis]|nr:hypothetical protein D8911_11565 [Levilactobacillus brevis]
MTTTEFIIAMKKLGYEVMPSENGLLFEKYGSSPTAYGSVDTQAFNCFDVRNVPSQVVQVILSYASTPFIKRNHI